MLVIEERDKRKRSDDNLELRGAFMDDFTAIENFLRESPPQSYGANNMSPVDFFNTVIKQSRPVLLSAPGGSGKTHFLIDIALEALEQGYAPFWLELSKLDEESAGQLPLSAERIFRFSVAGGIDTFKAALPDAIVIADGLNERSDFRERIATGLAQLRRDYSASTILGDRLTARGSRENFKPATLSPLSIDEIRKHVGTALAEGENWELLLSSPFFLALYLKVRGTDTSNALTRNEMFRSYFATHVFNRRPDEWTSEEIAGPAYTLYQRIKTPAAPRSSWTDTDVGFKEIDLQRLQVAGAVTVGPEPA